MYKALIQYGEQTAVIDLPSEPFTLQCELAQIGIRTKPKDIPIKDDEDCDISVKLFAESDVGNSLAVLFNSSHSLENANLCAHVIQNAHPAILEDMEGNILHGQYYSPQAVIADAQAMTSDLIGVTVKYYCSLQIHISRLDFGKKYCHHSPTMEEKPLQDAIMQAVLKVAQTNPDILQTLKMHIQMALGSEAGEDESMDIQIRIAQIDKAFKDILNSVTAENQQSLLTDPRIGELMSEKRKLESRLAEFTAAEEKRAETESRLTNLYTILDGLKNHPIEYDDRMIRKILRCVVVQTKHRIKVVFIDGLEMEAEVEQ